MGHLILAVLVLFMAGVLPPPCLADTKEEVKKEDKRKEDKEKDKGALDTFEGEATDEESAKKKESEEHDTDSDDDGSLFLAIIQIPVFLTLAGGIQSWERVDPPAKPDEFTPAPRGRGEPLIPFFRVDLAYQDVESDVQAVDGRAEAGFGPFGVQVRVTHYTEDEPDDDLDFTQIHGLYRMSLSRYGEIDLGFGSAILDGNEPHSGFSFALPMIVQPVPYLGVGFRPAWTTIEGNSIADYDVRISAGFSYVTAEAGYRWLITDGATLKGPFLGGSVHF